ncbi:MAG TPA: acyltransferase [Dehalococcoidia bacterium]|nr:acyltransferase [Dehalococcoidia bacterium]
MPDRLPSGPGRLALRVASTLQRRVHGFAQFGEDALITPPYRIIGARRIHVGARTVIGPYAFISVLGERLGERYDGVLRIGDDTSIGQSFIVSCAGEIVIGSKVLISSNVHVGDTIHRYDDPDVPVIDQPLRRGGRVVIEDGAFIGINAVILPDVRIGRHAVVGAGAVVTRDVPDFCVAAGNPARVVRRYDVALRAWLREGSPVEAAAQAARVQARRPPPATLHDTLNTTDETGGPPRREMRSTLR